MFFEYRYAGKSHVYRGADLDYVRGDRDKLSGTPTDNEKYIAACARQAFARIRKETHRTYMHGVLKTLPRPSPSS